MNNITENKLLSYDVRNDFIKMFKDDGLSDKELLEEARVHIWRSSLDEKDVSAANLEEAANLLVDFFKLQFQPPQQPFTKFEESMIEKKIEERFEAAKKNGASFEEAWKFASDFDFRAYIDEGDQITVVVVKDETIRREYEVRCSINDASMLLDGEVDYYDFDYDLYDEEVVDDETVDTYTR